MAEDTEENGKTENNTDKEFTSTLKEKKRPENGQMEKE